MKQKKDSKILEISVIGSTYQSWMADMLVSAANAIIGWSLVINIAKYTLTMTFRKINKWKAFHY